MKRLFSLFAALALLGNVVSAQVDPAQDPAQEPAVKAVAKAMPAVVNINTESVVRRQMRDPLDAFFENYYGGQMRPPRVIQQKVQSLGSGFFVDATGYIVTNAHVVNRATDAKISVTTMDGKTYQARYIAGDADHDLAFLKVDGKEPFPYLALDKPSQNLLGQTCLVLGNPMGYGSSVARGILSAKGRTVTVGDNEYQNLLQTDAAINPGNSGGPIVDLSGRLMGVSSVKMSFTPQGVPTQGLGFAIPVSAVQSKVDEFKRVAKGEKLPEKPSLARKYFGLGIQDLTEKLASNFGYREGTGALISEVEPNSPAAKAGFEPGMLIKTIGRYNVKGVKDIEKLLEQIDSANRVDFGLQWWRKRGRTSVLAEETTQLVAR